MSHFNFSSGDQRDLSTLAAAFGENAANISPTGATNSLKTSGSVNPTASMTAFSVSEILQGAATYKPVGITLDAFNQSLSSDLSQYIRSEGGPNQILAGRQALLAQDILAREGFNDGIFSDSSSISGATADGDSSIPGYEDDVPGAPGSTVDPGDFTIGASGKTFPLVATKEEIISWGWSYQSTTNVHHSYNAADIFAATGTPVVAMIGGLVVSAKQPGSEYGTSCRIQGDDGLWYYYTHGGKGTLKVTEGQTVSTGTLLFYVGDSSDAQGTTPHLHFDISPVENGFARGYGFADGPLIDPQPILVELFNEIGQPQRETRPTRPSDRPVPNVNRN